MANNESSNELNVQHLTIKKDPETIESMTKFYQGWYAKLDELRREQQAAMYRNLRVGK